MQEPEAGVFYIEISRKPVWPAAGWTLYVATTEPIAWEIGPFKTMQECRDFWDTNHSEIGAEVAKRRAAYQEKH